MKIKEGFVLRQVGDEYVVITIGDAVSSFNGMIKINNSGVFIWKKLENGIEMDQIIDDMVSEFSIDKDTAKKDAEAFIDTLKKTNCFVD